MTDPATPTVRPVSIAFLGACQQLRACSWRDVVEPRTELVFGSRSLRLGQRALRAALRDWDGETLELRVAGYSWGGWTALQLLERTCERPGLLHPGLTHDHVRVRLALLDPVGTFRRDAGLAPWPDLEAWNVYQRTGCAKLRCPGPASWYRGRPIEGAWNLDVTDEGADHLDLGYGGWGRYDEGLASVLEGERPWFVDARSPTTTWSDAPPAPSRASPTPRP